MILAKIVFSVWVVGIVYAFGTQMSAPYGSLLYRSGGWVIGGVTLLAIAALLVFVWSAK